jgi:hypothetical protein
MKSKVKSWLWLWILNFPLKESLIQEKKPKNKNRETRGHIDSVWPEGEMLQCGKPGHWKLEYPKKGIQCPGTWLLCREENTGERAVFLSNRLGVGICFWNGTLLGYWSCPGVPTIWYPMGQLPISYEELQLSLKVTKRLINFLVDNRTQFSVLIWLPWISF